MFLLTDERLAEIRVELKCDLWPSITEILAMVTEIEMGRISVEETPGMISLQEAEKLADLLIQADAFRWP